MSERPLINIAAHLPAMARALPNTLALIEPHGRDRAGQPGHGRGPAHRHQDPEQHEDRQAGDDGGQEPVAEGVELLRIDGEQHEERLG